MSGLQYARNTDLDVSISIPMVGQNAEAESEVEVEGVVAWQGGTQTSVGRRNDPFFSFFFSLAIAINLLFPLRSALPVPVPHSQPGRADPQQETTRGRQAHGIMTYLELRASGFDQNGGEFDFFFRSGVRVGSPVFSKLEFGRS